MRLDYWLYMNEAEGHSNMVNTREARLNNIGRDLRKMGYAGRTVPHIIFAALLEKYDLKDITEKEIHKIERNWL